MAEVIGHIASAVVVPEPAPAKSPSAGAKRRLSSEPELDAKRSKIEEEIREEDKPSSRRSSIKAERDSPEEKKILGPDRRKSSVQEERKRGQRLFGGLLSTLSQSTPNGQQKRRQEIEKRQQEKAKQQKAEDEGRRTRKLADLKAVRKTEQIKFDEQSMRIKHTNMLAMANSLTTNAEPKLYYKPWELLPREEEHIKEQIAEAEALIEREVDEFYARYPKAHEEESSAKEQANITSQGTVGEPRTESPSVSNAVDTTNDTPVTQSDQFTAEKQSIEEHNGEVVVENEEDTVIY
ncbi:hypothetical protein LOCC1_G000891 [Lachnellula occidentalis]|uniref:Pinin/SDK/MemA protein domain-containing protein n=1 Tax=Lachnellula occidentalis TaxID=215460 RepID=A0A8H8S596_9HELO|nr:hypothetical protein LOCC1_G000891 [Lachnellula occidentalis]